MRNYVSRFEAYQRYATVRNDLRQRTMDHSYQIHYAESQLSLDTRNSRLPHHWEIA